MSKIDINNISWKEGYFKGIALLSSTMVKRSIYRSKVAC